MLCHPMNIFIQGKYPEEIKSNGVTIVKISSPTFLKIYCSLKNVYSETSE